MISESLNRLTFIGIFTVFLTNLIDCRIYSKMITVYYNKPKTTYERLIEHNFGFQAGGTVELKLQYGNLNWKSLETHIKLWLVVCAVSDGPVTFFSSSAPPSVFMDCNYLESQATSPPQENICVRKQIINDITKLVVVQEKYHSIHLIQCSDPTNNLNNTIQRYASCLSRLTLLNLNSNHLATDEMSMPLIYTGLCIIWPGQVMIWFLNFLIHFRHTNRVHQLLTIALLLKVVVVGTHLLQWQDSISKIGEESKSYMVVNLNSYNLEKAVVFTLMLLISSGWAVIRVHIPRHRFTGCVLMFLLYFASFTSARLIHHYLMALTLCFTMFSMYKCMKWCSESKNIIRTIRYRYRRIVTRFNLRYRLGTKTMDQQLAAKQNILTKFRNICAAYTFAFSLLRCIDAIFKDVAYVNPLTHELPDIILYISLMLLFRLRNFDPYDCVEMLAQKEDVAIIELPDVCELNPHFILGIPLYRKVEKHTQTPRKKTWNSTRHRSDRTTEL